MNLKPSSKNPRDVFDEIIDIGSRLELFVDEVLVEKREGVDFRLHSPIRNPIGDFPWKGSCFYQTMIRDGDLLRTYYRSMDPTYEGKTYSGNPGEITCYAESHDGLDWKLPELGLYEVNGSRKNNVILAGIPPFMHNFSPFIDTRPGTPANERFKALAGHPRDGSASQEGGLHGFVSGDGIHWKKIEGKALIPFRKNDWSHGFDSQNLAFWSEAEQLYVAYIRTWTGSGKDRERGIANWGLRAISRSTSPDFINWSVPVDTQANRPLEHLYTSQTQPYFRAPHIYVAFPSRYMPGRVGAQSEEIMKGSTDVLFMSSRSGSDHFTRLFTEAFIQPGLDPERWGNRSNYVALNVVQTSDSQLSIYHSKGGFRYDLRLDGFISIRAGVEPGSLLTKPLRFSGSQLAVNYSTSAAGHLRVEIQDLSGNAIPGFELNRCRTHVGDKIEETITWEDNLSLQTLSGQPVRIKFELLEADLFSFRFS